jgi:hypothetical protein
MSAQPGMKAEPQVRHLPALKAIAWIIALVPVSIMVPFCKYLMGQDLGKINGPVFVVGAFLFITIPCAGILIAIFTLPTVSFLRGGSPAVLLHMLAWIGAFIFQFATLFFFHPLRYDFPRRDSLDCIVMVTAYLACRFLVGRIFLGSWSALDRLNPAWFTPAK